jgi:hypothetical protein
MASVFPDHEDMASIPKTGRGSKTWPSRTSRERAADDKPTRTLAEDHLLYLLLELERVVTQSKVKWSPGLASGVECRLEDVIHKVRRHPRR